MYAKDDCKRISKSIEAAITKRWGWKVSFTLKSDGSFSWRKISGRDRYDMYPGMSKQQADDQVIAEIAQIIRRYMPQAVITSYEQSGRSVRMG